MTENINEEEKFFKEKLKQLEENKDYKEIKDKLDCGNNFIDYFLVVGLEPSIYKYDWLFSSDLETINKDHKEEIKPKIISSFPFFEKSTIAFDDSILNHCFPNGFKLVKTPIKPKIFSFILDNNYYNLNYPQKYLTCLIIYENLSQYKILSDLEKNITKTGNSEESNFEIYIPKCLLIMSLYPFFGEFEKILTEIYHYSQKNVNKQAVINEAINNLDIEKEKRKSSLPRRSTLKDKKGIDEIPIDKIIENLLIELPVPPRGVSKVQYILNDEKREIQQFEMNKLPIIDIDLKIIFKDFDIKDVITIYNYIFLESRILFFSKNIEVLNNYIYGLLALLYPFQYQYQVITILPNENFEIIESITPFIAGINQSYDENFFDSNNFFLSDCILVVDIDKGKFKIINEENKIPEFPSKYKTRFEKKLQDSVSKYISKYKKNKTFISRLLTSSTNSNSNSTDQRKEAMSFSTTLSSNETMESTKSVIDESKTVIDEPLTPEEDININNEDRGQISDNLNIDYNFNQEINELFFNFNASLLSNYYQYLNRDFYSQNTTPCLEVLFKVDDFLKSISSVDKQFYEKFITETQIFGDFLYLRMIPKNSKEKIRILPFDEKINENSNLRQSKINLSIFTKTKEYEFVDTHTIEEPRSLTDKEIEFYKDKKNQKRLLSYGVVVSEDKKDKNKIIFEYPIFPKLTTIFFLEDNIKDYFPPNNWNENIDLINEDLISKSHLGDVSIRFDDMKKYIYLCWMHMWALTFWYCEDKEKNYRFQELIKVIEKSNCYEMEIFNLLFDALSEYGKDNMVLRLYYILLKKKLNPNFKVHNIVMKIMEGKKIEGNFSENLEKIIKSEEKKTYKKSNFSPRTFKSKYYQNILTEDIKFYTFDSCIFCQKIINLELLSKNIKEDQRELQWAICPECKQQLLPKLAVQFGKEINKNGEMKINTCNYENVILFSPYVLKNNYNTLFSKKVGIKLDVDDIMIKYSNIFWNSLWYFKLNKLEYDFMLPYYYRVEEIKPFHQFNINFESNDKNNEQDEEDVEEVSGPFDMNEFKIINFNFVIQ